MIEIFKYISIIDKYNKYYLDQKLAKYQLTSTHASVILHCIKKEGISQECLKNHLHLHPSNITRALEQLETLGYINKFAQENDKRAFVIYPTDKAKEVFKEIQEIKSSWGKYITQKLSEEDVNTFLNSAKLMATEAIDYFKANGQKD